MSRTDALVARLNRYMPLDAEERERIERATERERRVAAGEVLFEEGGENDSLYVVQQGWLHSSVRIASTGGRQILRFHYAGDLMGTSSIAWSRASATLTAVSDCIVSEMPKATLGRLFVDTPRLAGLLYAVAAAEAVAMSDRLTSIGRTDARERLITLLLDMLARLRVTAGGVVDSFELPLTQADLGDATGMTKVHVNRTFRAMEAEGLIERKGKRVRIVDEPALIRAVDFVDRYGEVATDWLPRGQGAVASARL
ncbi:Crp/Fnr family transcriptional regulator [Sphingomonas sp.]|uniref:Crp/Fnr family transcriptional regulator n=1 Tax=Sphingomonas sp. TaxID=28214 RepID=UPI003AFFB586